MKYVPFTELTTDRLRLRKLTLGDIPLYYERIGSSPEVTQYMLFQPHRDISESVASVQKALGRYAQGKCYRFCIAMKDSDELIGIIEPLRFGEAASTCSFAYMLGKEFWGRGYGTEALKAVLDFLFERMEMERVEADHMAENAASGAVMRKAGMVPTAAVPGKYEKNGILHDALCYAITREQWRKLS
jgi:ribosomal-protein-alanine N-acetyltransferase